ncbi:class I SAM-dependent rRNA methyltransferase [Lacunimicrobium album]
MSTPLTRVFIKPRKALPFFSRHPWVFEGAIQRVEGKPQAGQEVLVVSAEGQGIARGLYNPNSNIRVRLVTWNLEEAIDAALIRTRLSHAVDLRRRFLDLDGAGAVCRLVNSEGDSLPGITVDYYDGFLSLQVTSLAFFRRLDFIKEALLELVKPKGIWLKCDAGINEAEGIEASELLLAGEMPASIIVNENDLRYHVDLAEGQKTGFYCDQRDNRRATARYVDGGEVLDAFCYSGGFGLNALQHGKATTVLSVDSSEPALELTRRNAELNGLSDRVTTLRGKALEVLVQLAEQGRSFPTVILDPPKMVSSRGGIERGMKGYLKLNLAGLKLLPAGGILTTCSCSGHVSMEMFQQLIATAATQSGRTIQILEARGHTWDHAVSANCPESSYLKCMICRVL